LATVVTWPRSDHEVSERLLRGLDLSERERADLLQHALDLAADDVAASDLRQRLRAGETRPLELLPEVAAYVQRHGLYR
jgi:nicotinic acid mononucleotide adenylyltransferase